MRSFRIESCWFAALLATVLSCSIKEDRTGCPCLLTVDLSETLDVSQTPPSRWDHDLVVAVFPEGGDALQKRIPYQGALPEHEFKVPKGEVDVTGMLGLDNGILTGNTVRYPEGSQSDPLFLSFRRVPCYGEEARTELHMFKQYANVEIFGLDTFDYRMVASAGSSGLDLLSGKALEGGFRYGIACDEEGVCHFRLPRQGSDDLKILMFDTDGHLDNSIPLGKYLTGIGYDWDAPSLSDVSIHIDFVTASIGITVGDWTQTVEFTYSF